ncbi:MAG: hypothetical protein JAY90_18680 [Candidatus Thiodiazotropha lotti]|nr:hypothetical protein [Candidatus Thiodiazotropha lotti]
MSASTPSNQIERNNSHQRVKPKLPPYGTQVGNPPNGVWVCIGADAWEAAQIIQRNHPDKSAIVLPDGHEPDQYRWPVKGPDVIICVTSTQSPERIHHLGEILIMAGADRVNVVGHINNLPEELCCFKFEKAEQIP